MKQVETRDAIYINGLKIVLSRLFARHLTLVRLKKPMTSLLKNIQAYTILTDGWYIWKQ